MTAFAPTNRITFQGEYGANSDMACRNMYPGMDPHPCRTFEDAFNSVTDGEADFAMIPIENTIAGRVADIHHLLPESNLYIVGEYFMPIHFQLMVKPGASVSDIQSVYSHVHALGQCRRVIRSVVVPSSRMARAGAGGERSKCADICCLGGPNEAESRLVPRLGGTLSRRVSQINRECSSASAPVMHGSDHSSSPQ